MSRTGLVLAAHGSRADPSANALVREYARRLDGCGLFDVVSPAFHQGEPAYARVLDDLGADEVTVVPMMTSAGYFSEEVLPRELAKNRCYDERRVRRTPPVGTHPALVSLVAERVRARLRDHVLDPRLTTLALVGHGTDHHEGSRLTTLELVKALRRRDVCEEVLPAFLDEDPRVEDVIERAAQPGLIVCPFLIGGGAHATHDVPTRLGLKPIPGVPPPLSGWVGRRFVVCDAGIGTDPGLIDIVVQLARSAPNAGPYPSPTDRGEDARHDRAKFSQTERTRGGEDDPHRRHDKSFRKPTR